MERMEERKDAYRRLVGKPEGKRTLGRLNVDRSIIIKLIFRNE